MTPIQILIHRDVLAWLIFAIVALSLASYEIWALQGGPFRTISEYAWLHGWLRWTIFALFFIPPAWWLIHSGHPHPA